MTALTTSNSLTLFGTEVAVTNGFVKLSWDQMEKIRHNLNEARRNFVDSLDFINNEFVSIDDIGDINRFWFELTGLISDMWFDGMSITDINSRFEQLIKEVRR